MFLGLRLMPGSSRDHHVDSVLLRLLDASYLLAIRGQDARDARIGTRYVISHGTITARRASAQLHITSRTVPSRNTSGSRAVPCSPSPTDNSKA